jgi:hypothetical protein
MATVRTQLVSGQRRIITKVINGQRRVSCSCCPSEEGCCMYPADQLGVGYTAEDLPDEIMWFINVNLEQRFAWPKVGHKYVRQFCDDEECYEAEIRVEGGQWLFGFDDNVPPAYWFSSNCLFQEGDEQGFVDNFADTYTAYVNGPADVFDETFLVIRRSLCVWSSDVDEGEPSGVVLTAPQSSSLKWVLDVFGFPQAKDDPQNSPIGLYDDTGTEIS